MLNTQRISTIGMSLALSLLAAAPDHTLAADGAALLAERRCYTCHHIEQTLLGPSYRAVAARHGSRQDVMTRVLAQKILNGGGGNWGYVPMVPSQHVTPAEAEAMAAWILSLPVD